MRITLVALVAAMTVLGAPVFAELQNIQVGGEIRIRGNWYSQDDFSFSGDDDLTNDLFFVEQRTKVNVQADFTDDVSAFIELDSYNLFGDEFRGLDRVDQAYTTYTLTTSILSGVDNELETPVGFYQGFIEMREAWGYPLTFRLGRQELQFGSEWLVGNNDTSSFFSGLSFDALLMRYDHDMFNVTAFWSRLAENTRFFVTEEAGDVDFMGVYGSYTGLEDMVIDAYWLYLRDPRRSPGAPRGLAELHTVGARFAGVYSGFDWDVEGAYQFGDTGLAAPADDVGAFGATGEGGYTFDIEYQPRIFVHGAYFDADEEEPAFNRLFSDHNYSQELDLFGDLTNVWLVGGGASAQVTEEIELSVIATYYQAVEELSNPDDDLGIEAGIYANYQYSEDLYFEAGYSHFFAGDGVEAGLPVLANGVGVAGGFNDDEDQDYVYVETGITF